MVANKQGLINGGLAGIFWSYIWTFIAFTFVQMSLAEMASMYESSEFNPNTSVLILLVQGTYIWGTVSLGFRICAT